MASDAEQAGILGVARDKLEEDLRKLQVIVDQADDIRRISMNIKDDMNEVKTTMIMVSEGAIIQSGVAMLAEGENQIEIVTDEINVVYDACNETKGIIESAIAQLQMKIDSLLQ